MGLVKMNCPGCGQPMELDDSREFGFCSYCGNKVMVDRMIVEHKGSVKINNDERIQNCLAIARRAYENQDWESAQKNFSIVEQEMPGNLEVLFFSIYCRTMNMLRDVDYTKREQYFNALYRFMPTISLLYRNSDEDIETIKKICNAVQRINSYTFVYEQNFASGYGSHQWQINLSAQICKRFVSELEKIRLKYDNEDINQFISEYYEKIRKSEKRIEEERAKGDKLDRTSKLGAIIGGIIGAIIGIWFANLVYQTVSTPLARINNPPEYDWLLLLIAFAGPTILFAIIGGVVAERIAKNK